MAMQTSSKPGGAAVREAGEEEDNGEVAGLAVFCLGSQQEEDRSEKSFQRLWRYVR